MERHQRRRELKDKKRSKTVWLTGALIMLTACNLRAPITGVGPLVTDIRGDLGLSPEAAGLLTTIPLIAFAAVSPMVSSLSRRMGAGNLMLAGLAVMGGGIIIRSVTGNAGVFVGTLAAGAGIAVGNVLLPAIVKTFFPGSIENVTSGYTALMQAASAVSTAVSVPLAGIVGWKAALMIWLVTVAAAIAVCVPGRHIRVSEKDQEEGAVKRTERSLYRHRMTWWVTAYMGVQSFVFYSFIGWLPSVMQDRGFSQAGGGYMLSVYVITGIAGSCLLPVMMRRNRTQSDTGVQMGLIYSAGLVLMMIPGSSAVATAGIIMCGFCSGTCISFSMALFGLHTSSGKDASRLSGFAQSAGYLIAAAGPVLLGKAYGATGGWTVPLLILAAAAMFLIFAGYVAGKDEVI